MCVRILFDLIPRLSEHVNIVDTNDKGNIKYTCTPYIPMSQNDNPSEEPSKNSYSVFQGDSSTSDDPDNKLDKILQSDNERKLDISPLISPPKSGDTTPIRQFKDTFNNVTTVLDDFNTSKTSDSDTTTFIRDMKSVYTHMLAAFETTFTQISDHNQKTYETHCANILNKSFNSYKEKLNDISAKHLNLFDQHIQAKLTTYNSKINLLDERLKDITTKVNTTNIYKTPIPDIPKSKQSFVTPRKQLSGAVAQTSSIQQYFHQNTLKFDHHGEEYYLQDKKITKNTTTDTCG